MSMEEDLICDTKISHRGRRENSELKPAPHRHGGPSQLASRLGKKCDKVD